jgi:hypothetical protein
MRIVSTDRLSDDAVKAVGDVCDQWTEKLKSKVLVPHQYWWVHEQEFSTIAGEKVHLPLRQS